MRLYFVEIERFKATAKLLARLSPRTQLAKVHDALARVSGYRDWHELRSSYGRSDHNPSGFSIEVAQELVLAVTEELGLEIGDVQYALSKGRLLGSAHWSIEDQLTVYMRALRQGFLGKPGRGQPGTIIRVKSFGGTRLAYLLRTDRIVEVLYDSGEGGCATFETVTPRAPAPDFLPARLWLPYGVWTLEDGSEVVFSRDYHPLWRISAKGVERLDPWLWIKGIKAHRWFAENTEGDWWRPAGRIPALTFLEKNHIHELPKLANVMRHIFAPDVQNLTSAICRLHTQSDDEADLPIFAVLNTNLLSSVYNRELDH